MDVLSGGEKQRIAVSAFFVNVVLSELGHAVWDSTTTDRSTTAMT